MRGHSTGNSEGLGYCRAALPVRAGLLIRTLCASLFDLLNLRERHALLLNPAFRELLTFELDGHAKLCAAPTRESRQALYASLYPAWSPLLRAFLASQAAGDAALPQEGGLGFTDIFLEWFRPWLAGRSVLELGCGGGRSTRSLVKMAKTVAALDVDPGLLDEARAACPQVEFAQSSLSVPLPFASASFDTVYWNDVAEHLHPDDLAFCLVEIARVLRHGGVLCTVTCHVDDGPHDASMAILPPGSPPQGMHLQEFTYASWNRQLGRAGFIPRQPVVGINPLTKARALALVPKLLTSWSPFLLLEGTAINARVTALRWLGGTNVICSIAEIAKA